MKNIFSVVLILITLSASAQITFQRSFDFGRPLLVEQQPDSGYMIICKDSLYPNGVNMLRLDKSGDTLWTRSVKSPAFNIQSSCSAIDGGYLISGFSYSGTQVEHATYAKLTNSGTIEWSHRIVAANSFCTSMMAISKTSDSCYITAGRYSLSIGSTHGNTFMVKINPQGDTLWTKVGSIGINRIFNIIQTPDGKMLIGGNRSLYHMLSKIDNQGNPQWEINYDSLYHGKLINDMVATSDGSFLCAGIFNAQPTNPGALDIIKVNSAGTFIWAKRITSQYGNFGNSIAIRPDGGFFLFGTQHDTTVTNSGHMYLASMDSSGNMLWDRLYGVPPENNGYKIITTSDGGALLAGTYGPHSKLYLVKIDSTGYSGCNEYLPQTTMNTILMTDSSYMISVTSPPITEFPVTFTYESGTNYFDACNWIGLEEPSPNTFRVFPNPANDYISIQLDQVPAGKILMELFDVTGKRIKRIETNYQENNIELGNVVDGIYFLKITGDNKQYGARKIIVNKHF